MLPMDNLSRILEKLSLHQKSELCARLLGQAGLGWRYSSNDLNALPTHLDEFWETLISQPLTNASVLFELDRDRGLSELPAKILGLNLRQKAELCAQLMGLLKTEWRYDNSAQCTLLPERLMEYWPEMKKQPLPWVVALLDDLVVRHTEGGGLA